MFLDILRIVIIVSLLGMQVLFSIRTNWSRFQKHKIIRFIELAATFAGKKEL